MSRYSKALVAVATALLTLGIVLPEGITGQESILIALDFLGALGVYAIPNASKPPTA